MSIKKVGKREFIQHTSTYLKWVDNKNQLIITHQNKPALIIIKIKPKAFSDLKGLTDIKVEGDMNEHVLPGYDEWLS